MEDISNQTAMILGAFFWLTIGLWIWALIDLFKMNRKSSKNPTLWLLLILFFPALGSILYFLIGKKQMKSSKREFNPQFNQN